MTHPEQPNGAAAQKTSIWSAAFVILMVTNFFQSMAVFMTNTTIPLYLDSLGASAATVGVTVGAFAISALLVRPFAGPAFDSFSKKRLLMASQGVICAALLAYSFSTSVEAMFAARLVHGVGMGGSGPLAIALVTEQLPEKRLASGISIYMLAQTLAQVIGPAAGLWLAGAIGYSWAYRLAAALFVAAAICLSFVKEGPREKVPYRLRPDRMFAREALAPATITLMLGIAFSGGISYLVLYAAKLGVEGIGAYYMVYACGLLLTRPLFGKLADEHGTGPLLAVGMAFFAASYVMLHFVTTLPGFLAVALVASAGFGASMPLAQTQAMESVPPSRRGAASNTSYTGLDLGGLLGPIMSGHAIDAFMGSGAPEAGAYADMWLVMIVPIAVGLAVNLRGMRKR